MAGSIQKRGKESYLLTYHMGYDQKGERLRKTKTVKAKNKSEAKKELAAFVTEIEMGTYVAPSYTPFSDFVSLWRKDTIKKVAPQTIETYNYILDNRILPHFGHIKVKDITHIYIANFIEKLAKDGLASATIQKHYNILNSIFKLALKNEMIKKNPMDKVDKPSVTYKPGEVYNSQELKELYGLLSKEDNKQMVLMIKMALKTGMRKGELLALRWDDINFDANTIQVSHSLSYTKNEGYFLKTPKTKYSVRKIAPPKKLMEELKQHKAIKDKQCKLAEELWGDGEHYFVFSTDLGKPFFPDVPNRWWTRFLTRVNKQLEKHEKQPLKRIRFHDLRHTATTDLINKGVNIHSISKRLGHSNIGTTMNIYGHYLDEADQKIAELLDDDYI